MILKERVAIVTGGSRGIGKAIATAYAREGSLLIICARTEEDLRSAQREIKESSAAAVEIFRADVSHPNEVKGLLDFTLSRFGTVDILVNCAGVQAPIGLISDIDTQTWLETIRINLCGTFLCIKAVLPAMMKKRRGKIINFSGGGAVSPRPRFSAYSASKAAVVRLTETVAHEISEYGIDINAIAPGAVNTRMLEEVLAAGEAAGKEELGKATRQKQEGGVAPEEVAGLAVFLASPASDGLSGRLISYPWDNWREMPQRLDTIMSSDIYTMRRVTPKDRGHSW